jgi:hypothetical protein
MKKHVAATLLGLTVLGLADVHLDLESVDDGHVVRWQGRQHDVRGALAEQTNAWWRSCGAVQRLHESSDQAQQVLRLIAQHSPPDSTRLQLVRLLKQGDWLVAELTFERLSPAVVLLQSDGPPGALAERAIWSGSTEPWRSGPHIRAYLRSRAPQAPQALLDCLDPVSFGPA